MSERIFAQHLHDRRNNRVSTVPLPATTCFLTPSTLPNGRLLDDDIWVPPGESIASRLPPARSKGFCRGSIVDHVANRTLVYESALERDFACILMADRRVEFIHDQPPAVTYGTPDGARHRHTFDFLVRTTSGERIAFAVKPEPRVERSGIERTLAFIRKQAPQVADRVSLRTEKRITKTAAANARLILRSRRGRNDDDVAEVGRFAATLRGAVTIADIVQASKLAPARAWTAVVCLIDEGTLELTRPGLIDHNATVRNCAPRAA